MKKWTMNFLLVTLLLTSTGCGKLFKREDDEVAATSQGLGNLIFEAGNEIGLKNQALGLDLAQSFTPTTNASVNFVEITMVKQGNPAASQLIMTIEADAGGGPNNFPINGVTAIRTVADVPASHVTLRFNFSGTILLSANTKYWLRLTAPSLIPQPATGDLVKWAASQNNPYKTGEAKYQQAGFAWTNAVVISSGFTGGSNHDFTFRLGRQ